MSEDYATVRTDWRGSSAVPVASSATEVGAQLGESG
jgi:hypothetical protein